MSKGKELNIPREIKKFKIGEVLAKDGGLEYKLIIKKLSMQALGEYNCYGNDIFDDRFLSFYSTTKVMKKG